MTAKLKLAIALLLFVSVGFAQDEYKRGYELYKQGKYEEAIVLMDEAIATNPDWFFPIFIKASSCYKLKKYKQALQHYNDALTLEVPADQIPTVKYDMARIYMEMKDYHKAIKAFDDLIPLVHQNRHFTLYFYRGQCETQIARDSEEKNDLNNANSYYSKAIVSFTEALKMPTDRKELQIEVEYQKAYSQYKIGNYKGSMDSLQNSVRGFEQVLARDPKHENAHRFLIEVAFQITNMQKNDKAKQDRYADAVKYIDRFLSYWPNDVDMLFKKGLALQGAKQYKEAVNVFSQVTKKRPKDGKAYFYLGSCEMAAKDFNDAIKSFRSAVQNGERQNQNCYTFMAYCFIQQKTGCGNKDIPIYKNAVEVLEDGLKALPGNAGITRDLQSKNNNLNIAKENMETAKINHKRTLDNIAALEESIAKNRETLSKNTEMHLSQPTAELQKAIDEGKTSITADQDRLKIELDTLQSYVKETKRCGGDEESEYYSQMTAALNKHGR